MSADTSKSAVPKAEEGFVPFLRQFFPESLTLAALLAVLALLVTIPYLQPMTQLEMLATGFIPLISVQMSLILLWLLSAAVVESVLFGRFFDWVAHLLPTGSQRSIIYSTGFLALLFGWINWALGLIGAILIGRHLCRTAEENGVRVHYPLVLMAGLLSLVITNVGLSSPGALLMADPSGTTNFLVNPDQGELVIDMGAFLFTPVNIVSCVIFLFTLPMLLSLLAPSAENDRKSISEFADVLEGGIADTFDHYVPPDRDKWVFADEIEQSRLISVLTGLLGAISIVAYFLTDGKLTMLWALFTLMILGVVVNFPPMAFVEKVNSAVRWVNHLAIPFLLYASVYGLLSKADLYAPIGDALASTGVTQVSSYIVALIVGLLVPDPGSLWVIQGPALTSAGAELVPSLISVMYGAGVSNLWLGFLFIGLISSISGFGWREYLRYTAIVTIYVSVVVIALMLAL
ncbi:TIGR00366 family protein [Halomarina halobia]|uniref:TIGR00366 family protein n=1 Tax=Halomarina halobia TaxID=3033386 RepID=A0ABD6AEY7_9EURY|nr:TIGR00366 family protein [Halomarina sp. PSR21]